MEEAVYKKVISMGSDIVDSDRYAKAQTIPHHSKSGNIALHSLETAGYAFMIARWLQRHGVAVNVKDTVRASLLHDIGMTEDAVFLSPSRLKARTHPREGARIAKKEFGANKTQVEAILHHMWPVFTTPPRSIEGWIVTAADKCCSMHELRRDSDEIVEMVGTRLLRLWERYR